MRPLAYGNILALTLVAPAGAFAQETQTATPPTTQASEAEPAAEKSPSMFTDPEDGYFDVSGFLDTRVGFLPVVMPITEPAVGYGAGAGLAFFHTRPQVVQTPDGPRALPPNATMLFGMGTENGSWATGAGHIHTWNNGKVRYLVGGGYASLNLDWFGQSDAFNGRAFSYNLEGVGFMQKLTFKLGDSDFFLGPTQRLLSLNADFNSESNAGIDSGERDATVSGVGVTVGYDTRNSMFSPSRGTKASLSFTWNDEAIGSDFEYARVNAEVCQYVPLGGPFVLGLRGSASYAGEDAPFFDLASIHLRGIQAGRYVDNAGITTEAELRWDVTRRWTVVGFGGAGWVADEFSELDDAHCSGGTGFRYLVARKYDLRLGADVAHGPEDWAFYITVGTGWLRD